MLQLAVLESSGHRLSDMSEFLPTTHSVNHAGDAAPGVFDAVMNTINTHCVVTPERKSEIVAAAAKRFGDRLNLCVCGACGIREVQSDVCGYTKQRLRDLPPAFKFTEAQRAEREAMGPIEQVSENGSLYSLDGKSFVTCYVDPRGEIWHLYPHFVEDDTHTWFCKTCTDALSKKSGSGASPLSLAGGTDFSKMLPDFSLAEKLVLSDVRLFSIVVTVSHAGLADASREKIKGHIISFSQNGPTTAAGALNFAGLGGDIAKHFRVILVGPKGSKDLLEKRLLKLRGGILQLRPWAIWNALQLRKALSPRHRDLVIPPLPQLEDCMETLEATIVRDCVARREDDSFAKLSDDLTERNADVAGVRSPDEEGFQHLAVVNNSPSVDEQMKATLEAIQAAVFPPDAGRAGPSAVQPDVQLPREADPICEYTHNSIIIQEAFWFLFPTGRALKTNGILSVQQSRHMLLFWDGRCGCEKQLIFALGNQLQRADVTAGVTAAWRNHPELSRRFEELRQRESLEDDIAEAVRAPKSRKAREVIRDFFPLLGFAGRNVRWSRQQRGGLVSNLIAENRWFGLFGCFLSLSPHDVMGQLVIRLSVTPVDNRSFPAVDADGSLQSSLFVADYINKRAGEASVIGDFPIDLSISALHRRGAANAAITSEIFRLLVRCLFEVLVGLTMDGDSRKTIPVCERKMGIFGTPVSMHMVAETSGRQALHGHAGIVAGASATLLLNTAAHGTIRNTLLAALGAMYNTELPRWTHFLHSALDTIHERLPCPTFLPPPPTDAASAEFANRAAAAAGAGQMHRHCGRCHKGALGEDGCAAGHNRQHPVLCMRVVELLAKSDKQAENEDAAGCSSDMDLDGSAFSTPEQPPVQYVHLPDVPEGCNSCKQKELPVQVVAVSQKRPDARLVPKDCRVLAWEQPRRPLDTDLPDSKPDLVIFHAMLNDMDKNGFMDFIPIATRERLRGVTSAEAGDIIAGWRQLECANAKVADYNDVITNVLNCNNAPYFLGAGEGARAALFYMIKYITKDSVELSASLTVFADALASTKRHGSRAEDAGTSTRDGKLFAHRILNLLNGGTQEFSDTQMAAMLIGCDASSTSNSYFYFYWGSYLQLAKSGGGDKGARAENEDEGDGSGAGEEDPFEAEVISETHELGEADNDDASAKSGNVRRYTISDQAVFVSPATLYQKRGEELRHLSPLEWHMAVSVSALDGQEAGGAEAAAGGGEVAVAAAGEAAAGDGREATSGPLGRKPNPVWRFFEGCPLAGSHAQKAKSKFPIAIFAGGPLPKQPAALTGKMRRNTAWQRKADGFAAFILTCYREWPLSGLPDFELTAAELERWLERLKVQSLPPPPEGDPAPAPGEPPAEFFRQVARGRLFVIRNCTHGLAVDSVAKRLTTAMRLRNRDIWAELPAEKCGRPKRGDGIDKDPCSRDDDTLRKEIDKLRADNEARQFNPRRIGAALEAEAFMDRAMRNFEELTADAQAGPTRPSPTDLAKAARCAGGELTSWPACLYISDDRACRVLESIKQPRVPLAEHLSAADRALRGQLETASVAGVHWTPPGFEDISDAAFDALHDQWAVAKLAFESGEAAAPGDPPFTPAQRALVRICMDDLLMIRAAVARGESRSVYATRYKCAILYALGGGGTGKSRAWYALLKLMLTCDLGLAYATAWMGVAAAPLGGTTLCGTFGWNGTSANRNAFGSEEISAEQIDAFVNYVGAKSVEDMQANLRILWIDEVSQVGPIVYGLLDRILRKIMNCDLPNGGVKVIWSGDYLQKTPVGENLPDVLVKTDVYGLKPPLPDTPRAIGLSLVRQSWRIDFTRVMRSSDPQHLSMQARLRNTSIQNPVTPSIVPPALTRKDIELDPGWMFATIGVVSNRERVLYNYHQAVRWAKLTDKPLIRWRLRFKGRRAASLSPEEIAAFYENELGAWQYFVQGAPSICQENVRRCNKGMVNGARGAFHSLSWFGKERHVADEAAALVNVDGFRIVTLSDKHRPTTINVRLARPADAPAWLASDTFVADEVVVPIELTRNDLELLPVSSDSLIAGLPAINAEWHPVELAFALTDHKLQGATLQYLLLSLAERSFMPHHDMNGYYVFVSRPTSGGGLRRLPCPQLSLTHLGRLNYSQELKLFEAGWVSDPSNRWLRVWDPTAAKKMLAALQREHGMKKRNAPHQAGPDAKKARAEAKDQVAELLKDPANARRAPLPRQPQRKASPARPAVAPSPAPKRGAAVATPSHSASLSILSHGNPFVFSPGATSRPAQRRVLLRRTIGRQQATLLTNSVWGGGPPTAVLCSNSGFLGELELMRLDLLRLRPEMYLNDEIINYAAQILQNEAGSGRRFQIAPSFAMRKALDGLPQDTIRWFRFAKIRTHLLSLDEFYLPLFTPPPPRSEVGHWALICFQFKRRRLCLFDSLPGISVQNWADLARQLVRAHAVDAAPLLAEAAMRTAHAADAARGADPADGAAAESAASSAAEAARILALAQQLSQPGPQAWADWTVEAVDVPRQSNGVDCGVFMLINLIFLVRAFLHIVSLIDILSNPHAIP